MITAILKGLAFVILAIAAVGGGIYYLMKTSSDGVRVGRFKQYQYCLNEEAVQRTREVPCEYYLIGKGDTHPSDLTSSEMEGLKRHVTKDRERLGLLFDMESSQKKYLESRIHEDKQHIQIELQAFNEWKKGL